MNVLINLKRMVRFSLEEDITDHPIKASIATIMGDKYPVSAQFDFIRVLVETELILKSLNPGKATRHDQIPARVLRDGASILAVPLVKLINIVIDNACVPLTGNWRKSVPYSRDMTKLTNVNTGLYPFLFCSIRLLRGVSKPTGWLLCATSVEVLVSIQKGIRLGVSVVATFGGLQRSARQQFCCWNCFSLDANQQKTAHRKRMFSFSQKVFNVRGKAIHHFKAKKIGFPKTYSILWRTKTFYEKKV